MKHNAVVNHALIVRAFCTWTAFLRLYWLPLLIGLVVLVGHAGYQFNQLQRGAVGQYSGYARVTEDPMRKFGGVQVVLEIDGKRYLALAHSVAGRRIAQAEAGNMLSVCFGAAISSASSDRVAVCATSHRGDVFCCRGP